MSQCWICGALADSAEHMVKASDIRSQFGRVTNKTPLFRHSSLDRNIMVPGVNTDKLKFKPSLCQHCNNARTQPYDKAWETLAKAVTLAKPPLKGGGTLPLVQIFGIQSSDSMLKVHLYFLKLLGCYSVEYGIPLPINHFAVCILNETPQPDLYLSFVVYPKLPAKNKIVIGHVNALQTGERIVSANWFYALGNFAVHVAYVEPGRLKLHSYNQWHPSMGTRRVSLNAP